MGNFLVEMKSSSKTKRLTLPFNNEEDAKQWGIKQTEVWKWNNARIIVTPVMAAPEVKPVVEAPADSKDVHVRQVEARKQKRLAEKEK
jgi:hypothetical protein